jgi:predicted transcriptional regulator
MEVLWTRRPYAIREIQEAFPKRNRPAYTTIQTTADRLETEKNPSGKAALTYAPQRASESHQP